MEVGIIGLGKMGLNLAKNMKNNKVDVIGFDVNAESVKEADDYGVTVCESVEELVSKLSAPKVVWLMLPAGEITKGMIEKMGSLLEKGDIVIEGGNSHYRESIKNYEYLKELGIHMFDCGTSGGINGALNGGNFMIGGDKEVFATIEPLYQLIAQEKGYLYTGERGSGHYLKMVHNGVEYGMMQAIGEGFEVLEKGPFDYDNEKVAILWNHGSVVRSWLMELAAEAFKEDPKLDGIEGVMYSSGEGKWTVEEALDLQVSIPVITTSLMMRYRSLEEDTFTGKVVASLRKGFGGHAVKSK